MTLTRFCVHTGSVDPSNILTSQEPDGGSKLPQIPPLLILIAIILILVVATYLFRNNPSLKMAWNTIQEGFPWAKKLTQTTNQLFTQIKLPTPVYQSQPQTTSSPSTQTQPTPQPEPSSYPTVFYVYLEYNPQTGTLTEIDKGQGHSLPTTLTPTQPTPSDKNFIYKLEVLSSSGKILQSGWHSDSKELWLTNKNTLQFRIDIGYQPKATIKLYLAGQTQPAWTGVMP